MESAGMQSFTVIIQAFSRISSKPFRPAIKANTFQLGDESPQFLPSFPKICSAVSVMLQWVVLNNMFLVTAASSTGNWTGHNLFSHIFKAGIINGHAVLPLHMQQSGVLNINQYCGHSSRFHVSYRKIVSWYPDIPSRSSSSKVYMKCGLYNYPIASYGSNAH